MTTLPSRLTPEQARARIEEQRADAVARLNGREPQNLEAAVLELLAKPGTKQIVFLSVWDLLKARRKGDFAECVNNAPALIADAPRSIAVSEGLIHPVHTPIGPQSPQVPMPEFIAAPFICILNTQVAIGPVMADVSIGAILRTAEYCQS